MKKITAVLLLLGTFLAASAQKLNESKYRINLPDYWKPGSKVWNILSDKLPQVCEELQNKDLCGDACRPRYQVEFYMSAPEVFDYYPIHIANDNTASGAVERWDFITYYKFECFLLLYDKRNDSLLTKLILVDTNDVFTLRNQATLRAFSPIPVQRLTAGPATPGSAAARAIMLYNSSVPTGQAGQTPFSYINENRQRLNPQEKDLLAVVDDRIRNL